MQTNTLRTEQFVPSMSGTHKYPVIISDEHLCPTEATTSYMYFFSSREDHNTCDPPKALARCSEAVSYMEVSCLGSYRL